MRRAGYWMLYTNSFNVQIYKSIVCLPTNWVHVFRPIGRHNKFIVCLPTKWEAPTSTVNKSSGFAVNTFVVKFHLKNSNNDSSRTSSTCTIPYIFWYTYCSLLYYSYYRSCKNTLHVHRTLKNVCMTYQVNGTTVILLFWRTRSADASSGTWDTIP